MDLGAYGNNCPKLNDTLLALVYYEGSVVDPSQNLTRNVEMVKAKLDQSVDSPCASFAPLLRASLFGLSFKSPV